MAIAVGLVNGSVALIGGSAFLLDILAANAWSRTEGSYSRQSLAPLHQDRWVVVAVVCVLGVAVVAATSTLASLRRRREEQEAFHRPFGAPLSYTSGAATVEGGLLGMAGGLLAAVATWLMTPVIKAWVDRTFSTSLQVGVFNRVGQLLPRHLPPGACSEYRCRSRVSLPWSREVLIVVSTVVVMTLVSVGCSALTSLISARSAEHRSPTGLAT